MKKRVVVVAPTYNEEDNIGAFIKAVLAQKPKLSEYILQILVSDSHSSDETGKIVKQIAAKNSNVFYLDVKERGLGLGLSKGLDYAVSNLKADYIVTMESDLSCDPKQLPQFLKLLNRHEVVVGSRYMKGGVITNWSWWRKALSWVANLLLRILAMKMDIHEFTNLYRAFTKESWQTIRVSTSVHLGWIFVPAFVFEAIDKKLNICETPIIYFDRFGGRSKMRTLSYTKNLLHYALRFRIKKIYGTLS